VEKGGQAAAEGEGGRAGHVLNLCEMDAPQGECLGMYVRELLMHAKRMRQVTSIYLLGWGYCAPTVTCRATSPDESILRPSRRCTHPGFAIGNERLLADGETGAGGRGRRRPAGDGGVREVTEESRS
jgi:hypothetical protein